jgi:hypothetical protein
MATLPLSLADYAAEPKPLVAGVANILRKESKIMDILPFPDVAALSINVVREGNMPSVSWRNIGADHSSAKATKPTEVTEEAFSIGNEIDVDKVYMKDKSARLYDPRTYQQNMVVKSIARNFSNVFINGLPSDNSNPVGLFHRNLYDQASSQRINGNVDISADASTLSANIQTFIDALDSTLYAVTDSLEGGQGVYVLCNDTLLMRINSIFRQSGLLSTTQDALGRTFMQYKGATFIDMGLKYDESTRIIGNAESGTALSGGAATSAYAIKVGREYLTGWQMYGLEVSDWVLQSNQVTYKQVIDWMVGIAMSHPRSVARLYGITAA